jgi:hypothetical protein
VYRVRIVLEALDPERSRLDSVGESLALGGYVELPLTGPDSPFAGSVGDVEAEGLPEEAAFRLVGRLAEALEEGLALESAADARSLYGASSAPLAPAVPAGERCQSPLEAYCGAEAVCRVSLLEPAAAERGDSLVVCSPCGERLWAEGVAGEPWECESGAAGDRCFGFAVVVAEAPGYGAAGAMNACRPCAAVLADQVAASAAAV